MSETPDSDPTDPRIRRSAERLEGRPLALTLLVLLGLRFLVHFAVYQAPKDLPPLALMDVGALVLFTTSRVTIGMLGAVFGGLVVFAVGAILPLAFFGWLIETAYSATLSELFAFVGITAIGAGATTDAADWLGFILGVCLAAGGTYGVIQNHTVVLESALLVAPYLLGALAPIVYTLRFGGRAQPREF